MWTPYRAADGRRVAGGAVDEAARGVVTAAPVVALQLPPVVEPGHQHAERPRGCAAQLIRRLSARRLAQRLLAGQRGGGDAGGGCSRDHGGGRGHAKVSPPPGGELGPHDDGCVRTTRFREHRKHRTHERRRREKRRKLLFSVTYD
eukprot:1189357-Prorocentrum_minimum.AAC.1